MAVQLPPLSFPPLMPFIGSSLSFGPQHHLATCGQPHFPLQSFLPSQHFQMTNVGSTPRPQQQPLLPALHMVLPAPPSHYHQPCQVERFAMPAPAPARAMVYGSHSMPTSPVCSPPPSPSSEERRMKRKRAMSVPPTGSQQSLMARASSSSTSRGSSSSPSADVQPEITFENGSQVAKWKLNGPRYKRCKVTGANGDAEWKRCQHCNTDSTPEWRTGPLGKGTLCNACGLRYRSKQREQSARGQGGNVPVSLLLNPTTSRKGRTNISNPLVWETKLSSFPVKADSPQQPHAC